MSPFAQLLAEARDRLRRRNRRTVAMHFDWDGEDGPRAWKAWCDDPALLSPDRDSLNGYNVFSGVSGEEALRNMVDAIRKRDGD